MDQTVLWNLDGSVTVYRNKEVYLRADADTARAAIIELEDGAKDVPESVAAWACKAVLESAGLYESIEKFSVEFNPVLKWKFRGATRWYFNDVVGMAATQGLTQEQATQMYLQAASIEQAA